MNTDPQRWQGRAACRGVNPALFYDPHPDGIAAAKQVCATCPVRVRCRTHAVTEGEEFGVWGGLADHERPAPSPRTAPAPGPQPRIPDAELYDLFADSDPERPALEQLLEHVHLPTASAYKTLARAVRLGVVERRGRALYPLRR